MLPASWELMNTNEAVDVAGCQIRFEGGVAVCLLKDTSWLGRF